jgi:ABC-type transport system involved in cytochrome c biogenesis permease component
MVTATLIMGAAVLAALWSVVASILVYENLRRRGQKVSFFWLRVLAPWYVFQYKKITKAETGKVGPLFYHWIISINLALIFGLAAIVIFNWKG